MPLTRHNKKRKRTLHEVLNRQVRKGVRAKPQTQHNPFIGQSVFPAWVSDLTAAFLSPKKS